MKVVIFLFVLGFTLMLCAPVAITIDEAKQILEETGLMSGKKVSELSANELEDALKQMQKKNDLPATGKFDQDTIAFLSQPRCGQHTSMSKREIITISSNPWMKSELTYKCINYPRNGLDKSKAIKAITKSFETWSQRIPITFQLQESGATDMTLEFEAAEDGDGPLKTIAYAFSPTDGGIYYDEENWTIYDTEVGLDLFLTSVHEIGHSLGLRHSELQDSIMFPFIRRYKPGFKLHHTDVTYIQKLYGTAKHSETCLTENIDALIAPNSNTLYAIKADQCWKYIKRKLQKGYPKSLDAEWPGLNVTFVDAAYHYDNAYYFISNQIVYIYANNKFKQEKLSESVTKVDAVVTLEHRIYYFVDSSYRKYTRNGNSMVTEKGFPKAISKFWLGVPSHLDAGYNEDDHFHFFKVDTVYTFNMIDKHKVATQQKISEFLQCT